MCYSAAALLFFASKVTQITGCAYCVVLYSKVLICCFTSQQSPHLQLKVHRPVKFTFMD